MMSFRIALAKAGCASALSPSSVSTSACRRKASSDGSPANHSMGSPGFTWAMGINAFSRAHNDARQASHANSVLADHSISEPARQTVVDGRQAAGFPKRGDCRVELVHDG